MTSTASLQSPSFSSQAASGCQIALIAGLSGAGKTTVMKTLEDAGFYALDHLPSEALLPAIAGLARKGAQQIAIGLDLWDRGFLRLARAEDPSAFLLGAAPKLLLLEASDAALIRRFSETRRKHPLSAQGRSLVEAIVFERRLLERLRGRGDLIDTSEMKASALKARTLEWAGLSGSNLRVSIESFGHKRGGLIGADLLFDARCLPNPHYDPALKNLTGLDDPVIEFFERGGKAEPFARMIADFALRWMEDYKRDQRSYLTIGIGCTGGQHRSVRAAEMVAQMLRESGVDCETRHRESAHWPSKSSTFL